MLRLASVFALDICAYAVMSNHYHIVLHINVGEARKWPDDEVIERWQQLFKGSLQSQQYVAGETLPEAHRELLEKQVEEWRSRLTNISWFMRILNEKIARKANQEDGCSGRFWEGRFKSQAPFDEKALMACMAYVDLNPIRANMVKTSETSSHTSIKRRCEAARCEGQVKGVVAQQPCELERFVGYPRNNMLEGLPFRLTDYLELVDWTGRQFREDKGGGIDSGLPVILERLDLEEGHWLYMTQNFESSFKTLVGSMYSLKKACKALGYERLPGRGACETLFGI